MWASSASMPHERKVETLILMHQDQEVLSFRIDYPKVRIQILEKLAHFELMPKGPIIEDSSLEETLLYYLDHSSLSPIRPDFTDILKATGCSSAYELAFLGHGLSLRNHYWFKRPDENLRYQDINFFTNPWDDSFARAVLNHDYEALKTCDYNVPDVTTPGGGIKGWIREKDGPKLYKLGLQKGHDEEALGEVLASRLAKRLFGDEYVLTYELKKIGDQYASCSPLMIGEDEELIPMLHVLDAETWSLYNSLRTHKQNRGLFYKKIFSCGIPGLGEFFTKIACLKDLCFVSDLHFGNVSLIRNVNTGAYRIAPIYDLGGAFGSTKNGQYLLSNATPSLLLVVYYTYSSIDPSWDYSWFDPSRLDGFEEEIKETLSKSKFYTPELIASIIAVYSRQKATLEEYAKGNQKQ